MTDFGKKLQTMHRTLNEIILSARNEQHFDALQDEHIQTWSEMKDAFINMYDELCSVGPFECSPLSAVRDDVMLFESQHLSTNSAFAQFVDEINNFLDLYNQDRDTILETGKI